MSLKKKWIPAALALGALIACMKAGDGVGLDNAGRICADNSKDTVCFPYIDRCKANPGLPGCPVVDPCVAAPASKACSTSMCEKDSSHSWCKSIDCAATPTAQICVDSCAAHPDLAWCKVDCAVTPNAPECASKTKFSEVYAVFQAEACATCHSGTGLGATTGKLNFGTLDSAYANLVNKPATNQTLGAGWKRVVPGMPDSSILYFKVSATAVTVKLPNGKSYLNRMPLDLPPISKANIDLIRKWIEDGALK